MPYLKSVHSTPDCCQLPHIAELLPAKGKVSSDPSVDSQPGQQVASPNVPVTLGLFPQAIPWQQVTGHWMKLKGSESSTACLAAYALHTVISNAHLLCYERACR